MILVGKIKKILVSKKNHTKTWTLLRNLRPFTTYRFRLSTWNQLGEVDELIKKKIFVVVFFLGQISGSSNNVTSPEESKIIY